MTPTGWKAAPLKRWASARPSNVDKLSVDGEATVRLCNYVDVYKNERITDEMDLMLATASAAQIQRFTLQKQDVIVTKDSETPDDIGVPAHVPEDLRGVVCGYHLTLLRPDASRLHGGFLFWALQSSNAHDYFATSALGITRYALNTADIEQFPLIAPGPEQQERIANFLDDKTARIDALIAEKEQLVECLAEYRQAWLSESLKSPSGANKTRLKFCINGTLQYGATESGDSEAEGPRYIRITDIHQDGSLVEEDAKYLTEDQAKGYLLEDRDVLFARSGATVGKAFIYRISTGRAAFAGYLIRARLNARVLVPEYLRLTAETHQYWAYLKGEETQSTIQNASAEKFANFEMVLPGIPEQLALLKLIEPRLKSMTTLSRHAIEHIARLREYRSSLISAAVTGQMHLA